MNAVYNVLSLPSGNVSKLKEYTRFRCKSGPIDRVPIWLEEDAWNHNGL